MNRRGLLLGLGATGTAKVAKPLVTTTKAISAPKQTIATTLNKTSKPLKELDEFQKGIARNENTKLNRQGFLQKARKFLTKKAVMSPKETVGTGKKIIGTSVGMMGNLNAQDLALRQYADSQGVKKIPFKWLDNFRENRRLINF
jgi:hypothetical protein